MERYGIMPMLSGNDASTPMELEGVVNVRVQRTLFMVVSLFGWYGAGRPDCLVKEI